MKNNPVFFCLFSFIFDVGGNAQHSPKTPTNLQGKWLVEINSNDIGIVKTIFHFETEEDTFQARTRKNADRAILGFWKSTLARTFTKNFKKGALVRITDGIMEERGDTLVLAGVFRSAIGSYYFNGEVFQNKMTAVLRNVQKEETGKISGVKSPDTEYPLGDYPAIVSEALDTAESKIFNSKILETKDWKSFEKDIKKVSDEVKDDLELVFAFYYLADKLPISHFALTKLEEGKPDKNNTQNRYLTLEEKSAKTAYSKITSFAGSAAEVDSIFSIIYTKNYQNLIVDLRDNSGGSVEAGMAFAQHVLDSTLIGGVFLTQKWFNQNSTIPNQKEYDQFPTFSEGNYDMIIEGIHKEKGLVLKVSPNPNHFEGNLFILTNNATASTCEPIVYGLKTENRATIVGERTAGAMLNGEPFPLKSGFSVFVPTADYYAKDGYRIDQNGVAPDIEIEENPVEYIMENLIE